ncbi:hypothetical protein H7U19_05410 [Hyunsoonleella sp. SJ7]|uniref:Uncharacterized protein n=1 Tax=Hyunsoonleella aquatilis TaxID=2762758 RepID=A0A923HG58_9FLAO|nr:hypothetical protein [Hyunsoonleella aquatilis]MBC3757832.1 hypothetical protein [Hyunsoonleella aquatilis]
MKFQILFVTFLSFLTISGCSTTNDTTQAQEEFEIPQYHLIKVTGGIAGVDHTFDMDTVIWVFTVNAFNEAILVVENNNGDEGLEDGLDSGSYIFSSVIDNENEEYLFIENDEFGHVDLQSDGLVIDQNKTTNGTLSDGFIYTFKLKTVLIETGS